MSSAHIIDKNVQEFTFIELLIVIVVGWLLVDLWYKVIDNFAYGTLGMDTTSTYHSLIVALTVTIIFIIYATVSGYFLTSGENPSSALAPVVPEPEETGNSEDDPFALFL